MGSSNRPHSSGMRLAGVNAPSQLQGTMHCTKLHGTFLQVLRPMPCVTAEPVV
jgi:hypothetical protein